MLKAAKISFSEAKMKIFIFGIVNCVLYIILFLFLKWFNLMHFSGLRMLNYVIFFLLSLYQVKRRVKHAGKYTPSIQALGIIFLTGAWSFLLLAGFILAYSLADPYITEQYFNTYGKLNSTSSFLIFFEGVAGSTIVALIAMIYADMYKDGDKKI